ncbi:MAG: hypothetical protein GY749_30885 [Desulfobacteraceae bacterium]|nr:hypothetical protein [Desulfobacteraceae bacterium]
MKIYDVNPFNCTKPGNLFVGYSALRQEILEGLYNGHSFAVLGGRRIGKTSFLMQIKDDLIKEDIVHFHPLPRYFDLREVGNATPDILFEKIYNLVIQEIEAPPWENGAPSKEYENFKKHLDNINPILNQKYGADWLIILLVDEMDTIGRSLPDDQFFFYLRNFLMQSQFHRHFRIVATGMKELERLIDDSSPLNFFRNFYLGILKDEDARKLLSFGFTDKHDTDFLFELTGKHPFLLQGILEKLWTDKTEWNKENIIRTGRNFLKEHSDFQRWMDAFSTLERTVYRCLAESLAGSMHVHDIAEKIDAGEIEDALIVLSYHGVIDDSDQNRPAISGTLFRDWFINHIKAESDRFGEDLSNFIDHTILTGIKEQDESYQVYQNNKEYAKAAQVAGRIHEMCKEIANSLDREKQRDIYQKVVALSSYYRLSRDLHNARG